MKIAVVVISDRASTGVYKDTSGEAIIKTLLEFDNSIEIKKIIINDNYENIINTFKNNLDNDFIITSGGTGLSKRDNTPEATKNFCDREIPGISEYLRFKSLEETPYSILSRGYSGVKNNTIIVNFPGSEKGSIFCTKLLYPIINHAVDMLSSL